MPEPNPLLVGGVKIYVSEQKKAEVLPKEGNLNVVKYNGMLFKFPDQEEIKTGHSSRPPFINLNSKGVTEVMLKDAEINGSPENDKVESWCISSVFNFKGGGDDTIIHHKYNDWNYKEPDKNCRFLVNEDDYVRENHIVYDDDKKAIGEWIFTNKVTDGQRDVDIDYLEYDD